MRIIFGQLKGRKLVDCSRIKGLRPTSDKSRETVFNILNWAKFLEDISFNLKNANILDICCGSGSFSFEAISRGAKSATLIDNNADHLDIAKKNAKDFGIYEQIKFLLLDVKRKRILQNKEKFDLIFIDPPYEEDYLMIINNLLTHGWINEGSLLVVEFRTKNTNKITQEICDNTNIRLLEIRKSSSTTSFGFLFTQVKN
jgi:16S rRNA (guanine966-N2)-methyltransferase